MSDNEKDLEELDNVVVLTDEDGNDTEFEWLDTVEMADNQYVVLLPMDEEEAEEVVILRLEKDGEEENFVSVDSEEEINKVFELFKERNADDFDFVD